MGPDAGLYGKIPAQGRVYVLLADDQKREAWALASRDDAAAQASWHGSRRDLECIGYTTRHPPRSGILPLFPRMDWARPASFAARMAFSSF